MGTSLKRKEFAPSGSEFFPLRAVPYDMEITFATLGDLLECYYICYARAQLRNGSYANGQVS